MTFPPRSSDQRSQYIYIFKRKTKQSNASAVSYKLLYNTWLRKQEVEVALQAIQDLKNTSNDVVDFA